MTQGRPPAPNTFPASRQRQKEIGRELARQYAKVLMEPVPEQFLQLLEVVDRNPSSKEQAS